MEPSIVNLHCAGIDIGSKYHFVAIWQNPDDVKTTVALICIQ
jgi:hypothetical protein